VSCTALYVGNGEYRLSKLYFMYITQHNPQ